MNFFLFFFKFDILYYILNIGVFFLVINFFFSIIPQGGLYLNYINKYGYFISEIFLYFKLNNLINCVFFKFLLILLIFFLIFYLIINIKKKINF